MLFPGGVFTTPPPPLPSLIACWGIVGGVYIHHTKPTNLKIFPQQVERTPQKCVRFLYFRMASFSLSQKGKYKTLIHAKKGLIGANFYEMVSFPTVLFQAFIPHSSLSINNVRFMVITRGAEPCRLL